MPASPALNSAPLLEYSGTLVHGAEARTRVLDGQLTVPVLCLDLELDNTVHSFMHVEQVFPVGHFTHCQAAAHRLPKGTRVTVQAPLLDLRLLARNCAHIHVIKEPSETH